MIRCPRCPVSKDLLVSLCLMTLPKPPAGPGPAWPDTI